MAKTQFRHSLNLHLKLQIIYEPVWLFFKQYTDTQGGVYLTFDTYFLQIVWEDKMNAVHMVHIVLQTYSSRCARF